MFDIDRIRQDFPILGEKVYGKSLVYLDNAATAQRPSCVVEKMKEYYLRYNSNVHRGVHFLSNYCTDANEKARADIADFIGASSVREIVFTRGTTEAINLVSYAYGEKFVSAGDGILITEMEHHSNIVPWQLLCERKNAVLKVLPVDENGMLRMDLLDEYLSSGVKLVALAYVSNVLGTVNPVEEITAKAHATGALVFVDAAQAVQHMEVDVRKLDCDFLAFSGHKLYGPTGVGVLYGKEEILEAMPPWQGGGEMIEEVRFERTLYNDLPFKFEAGTPDFIGIVGLGEAVNYIRSAGIREIAAYEAELSDYMEETLLKIPGVRRYGPAGRHSSVFSFTMGEIHAYDLGTLLDKMGIAVRTGHLCAEPLLRHFGLTSVTRASLAMYNTKEEIDVFCRGLMKIGRMFDIS